jgi:hypothetical protein
VRGYGPETYAFPADEAGEILSWAELPGSMKVTLDHAAVAREVALHYREPEDHPPGIGPA